jgi:2-keto-4-pentenoate hydratase
MEHERAAALIWRHWQAGTLMDGLPPGMAPASRAEGYAIQAGLEAFSAEPRAGWKIAATSVGGQRHLGVDGPLAGRLLAEHVHAEGAVLSLEGNHMRVAEPEFAFRLGAALAPREAPWTVAEVLAAVEALHLAIELPDSRLADFARAGGPALIADNACARDLVVGPPVSAPWAETELAAHPVRIKAGERPAHEGSGAAVLGDPRVALAWLVNEVTGLGITIRAGELVTTGVCTVPLPVRPGDRVEADFGSLGGVGVSLSGPA